MNLKKLVPGVLAIGMLVGASSVQAQTLDSGTIAFPNAVAGVVSITGGVGTILGTPTALPTPGNFINFTAFNGASIASFANLPNSNSSGSAIGLNFPVSLVINGAAQPAVDITGSSYSWATTANTNVSTSVTPGAAQNFVFSGSTYTLLLNPITLITGGNPTSVDVGTITGRITNITTVQGNGPEPGTLILAGLGIAGLIARRRKH